MSIRTSIFGLLLAFSIMGCEKDEIVVEDNVAPPDHTVSSLVVETYINKCYISLLGRKPTAQEETEAKNGLLQSNLSVASRRTMLSPIVQSAEYRAKLLETQTIRLLTLPLDTADLNFRLFILNDYLDDPINAQFENLILAEIARLEELINTPQDVAAGNLSMAQLHKRLVNNLFYDELNMGSFNLVVSFYNHFLFRDPTEAETQDGITMVDGLTSVVFYTSGSTKDEFIDIFFTSNDYYEGTVRELFYRYLFREPTTEELNYHTVNYKASDDFQELQKAILSLDEFVGL
jgi:hypothetical protein